MSRSFLPSLLQPLVLSGMGWSLRSWWSWRRRSSWRRRPCFWPKSLLPPSKPSVCAANTAASTSPRWALYGQTHKLRSHTPHVHVGRYMCDPDEPEPRWRRLQLVRSTAAPRGPWHIAADHVTVMSAPPWDSQWHVTSRQRTDPIEFTTNCMNKCLNLNLAVFPGRGAVSQGFIPTGDGRG